MRLGTKRGLNSKAAFNTEQILQLQEIKNAKAASPGLIPAKADSGLV